MTVYDIWLISDNDQSIEILAGKQYFNGYIEDIPMLFMNKKVTYLAAIDDNTLLIDVE